MSGGASIIEIGEKGEHAFNVALAHQNGRAIAAPQIEVDRARQHLSDYPEEAARGLARPAARADEGAAGLRTVSLAEILKLQAELSRCVARLAVISDAIGGAEVIPMKKDHA